MLSHALGKYQVGGESVEAESWCHTLPKSTYGECFAEIVHAANVEKARASSRTSQAVRITEGMEDLDHFHDLVVCKGGPDADERQNPS
jgi:hypothetical protein